MNLQILKIVIAFKGVWPNAHEVKHVNVLQHLAITEFKDVNNYSLTNLSALDDYPNLMNGKEILCTYNDFMAIAEYLEPIFNELSINKKISSQFRFWNSGQFK